MNENVINNEVITKFLNGSDPMERIISIECGYGDSTVSIIYRDKNDVKRVKREPFFPFLYAQSKVAVLMFGGNKTEVKKKMNEYGIGVKLLSISNFKTNEVCDRMEEGFKLMFFAKKSMTYQKFLEFFKEAGTPVFPKSEKKLKEMGLTGKEFIQVSPVEQYMIYSGKRLFKGYDDYNDLLRLIFDLETSGLNPKVNIIKQIGIRTNKGYEKILSLGDFENELEMISEFFKIISQIKPDIVIGHNSENFDWNFIIERCTQLGTDIKPVTKDLFPAPLYKKNKESVLKLGGEMEYFYPTILWGYNIIDSLHAVRRAQALDSNMKSANLKYVTQYAKLNKSNRVYVPGDKIDSTWEIKEEVFAFNDENGDWYRVTENKPLKDGYVLKSGKYIVERYLLDDLYETDKVEYRFNESNFLVNKLLPTTFNRACTMGTAGIWKLIMMAWTYENALAIPNFSPKTRFTGGLSRLLRVGFVDNVVKLDYNSLYPSIDLTWNVNTEVDIMDVMLKMLEYFLTQREYYKELKSEFGKKAKKLKKELENIEDTPENASYIKELKEKISEYEMKEIQNDKKQLPLKIVANSFFGSYGNSAIFPWGDMNSAEKTTCIGRMSLRLMIKHFTDLGYTPIVGDSFLGDTPLYLRRNKEFIDIKPIDSLSDENDFIADYFNREYDCSEKNFEVLCRSGWMKPSYIYRHKTDKDIYEVKGDDIIDKIEVTEDHSLFNKNQEKIKPSEINDETELEKFDLNLVNIYSDFNFHPFNEEKEVVKNLFENKLEALPIELLNATIHDKERFIRLYVSKYIGNLTEENINKLEYNKTVKSGLNFIFKCCNNNKSLT